MKNSITKLLFASCIAFTSVYVPVFAENDGESEEISFDYPEEETVDGGVYERLGTYETDDPNELKENALVMLNYLTYTIQQVNQSKNSRRYLDEAYYRLVNDLNPEVIDADSHEEILSVLDIMHAYGMIAVKRERLDYIFEQNQAQALRAAVPNPMSVLNAVASFDVKKLAVSIVYMAVDSYTSYSSYKSQIGLEFLQGQWQLDDEESDRIHESRSGAFDYMVNMVKNNKLNGKLALNEQSVEDFVKCQHYSSDDRKIQFLESNEETYKYFGPYYLELARCYFNTNEYQKCLDAITNYEKLDIKIFRNDKDYASVIPLAVASLKELNNDDKYSYSYHAKKYLEKLVSNTTTRDWELKYFAAQTYLDLYAQTNKVDFLNKAYNLVLDNVNYLTTEQEEMNSNYVADVQEVQVPDAATKEKRQEYENYNKQLKEERKVELPEIYEPLLLNCELLKGITGQDCFDQENRLKAEKIMRPNGNDLFLVETINSALSIETTEYTFEDVEFKKDYLKIPAKYLSGGFMIVETVKSIDGNTVEYADWKVKKVERNKSTDVNDFIAEIKSETASKYKAAEGDVVTIKLIPCQTTESINYEIKYKVESKKVFGFVIGSDFIRE